MLVATVTHNYGSMLATTLSTSTTEDNCHGTASHSITFSHLQTTSAYHELPLHTEVKDMANRYAKYFGATATAIGAIGTVIASKRFNNVQSLPNTMLKASFAPLVGFGTYFSVFDFIAVRASEEPKKFGLPNVPSQKVTMPPLYKRLMNKVHDDPVLCVGLCSIPVVIGVGIQQLQKKSGTSLKERMLHSRGLAVGGLLSVSLLTAILAEYMRRNGKFPDDEDLDRVIEMGNLSSE